MTLGYNRNCQQFPNILGHCDAFLATQYKKQQEVQVCLNRPQEQKNQTADNLENIQYSILRRALKDFI